MNLSLIWVMLNKLLWIAKCTFNSEIYMLSQMHTNNFQYHGILSFVPLSHQYIVCSHYICPLDNLIKNVWRAETSIQLFLFTVSIGIIKSKGTRVAANNCRFCNRDLILSSATPVPTRINMNSTQMIHTSIWSHNIMFQFIQSNTINCPRIAW